MRQRLAEETNGHRNDSPLITRRRILLGIFAIAGAIAVKESISTPDAEETTRVFELDGNLKKELAPFTQSEIDLGDAQWLYERKAKHAQQLYPLTRNEKPIAGYMAPFLTGHYPSMDQNARKMSRAFITEVNNIGIIPKIASLRAENRLRAAKANLVLIPQIHPPSPWQPGADSFKHMVSASDSNITKILEVLKKFGPKIAVEGQFSDKQAGEEEIPALKERKPWLYDKSNEVYGIEPPRLTPLLQKIYEACQTRARCDEKLVEQIHTLYSILIREQFAIETSLERLSDDELGAIVIGAAHIPTMKQYLEEHHPKVSVETVIPKFH